MKKIFIVYEKPEERQGSIQIRGFQVYQELKKLNCSFEVEIMPVSLVIENEVKNEIILCIKPKRYELYKHLDKSNFIIFDILDTISSIEKENLKHISSAIFCSNKIHDKYSQKFKYPELCKTIYHQWDSRLDLSPAKQDEFSIGYFGERWKARTYSGIEQEVMMYHHSYLGFLNKHNCHYILKPDFVSRNYEPLTKISTAAAVGATVIAADDHAVELLGYNYPYYVNGSISDTIGRARETFKCHEWSLARQIMVDVKKRTSIENIIKEYQNLFEEAR